MARPERFELPTTWFEARYSSPGFTADAELNSVLGLLAVLYLENNEERDNVE